jgi:septum formation protein
MPRLILASQSVYRLDLLLQAGFEVVAEASGVAEPPLDGFSTLDSGMIHLAETKARAVASRHSSGVVLGCDTVGIVGEQILGKPVDREEARRMLQSLSGTRHAVATGWCLHRVRDGLIVGGVEWTWITMRTWSSDELEAYLDGGEWQGKCGAYGLQLPCDPFVTSISGSSANVIGVPVERITEVMAAFAGLFD